MSETTINICSPSGEILLATPINSGAKGYFSLMQHDYVTLPFSLDNPIDFGIGSYADLRGVFSEALGGKLAKIYYVTSAQSTSYNTATGGYDYQLRLDAYYWLWQNFIFKYTPENAGSEASWSLTAALDVHLGVYLRNLASLGFTYGTGQAFTFEIDSTVENKAAALTYDNTNLIEALNMMAEAWGCEWWVTENTIHFGRYEQGDAVELEIGVSAETMTRSESKGTYATRIYAFGSTRNIPSNYRPSTEQAVVNGVVQKRLMLPEGTPYIDAHSGLVRDQVVESVVVFDNVYPRRTGTLSNVQTVDRPLEGEGVEEGSTFKAYQYKDTGLIFSEDYILPEQELRIVFQSGKLNGLDFGVTFNPNESDPAEQLWEIVANEDYGRLLPDATICPENGDTYILYGFDIQMVSDQYIPAAEQELKTEAEKYVAKTKIDDGIYTVPLYSSWVKEDEINRTFDIGQKVSLKNPALFGASDRQSRVIGWEMNLDIPYDRPVYTVGESAKYSRIGELEDKVDAITYGGQTYVGGGGSGVYLIKTNDRTAASNSNAYSALRSIQEFLSKTRPDTASYPIKFLAGIVTDRITSLQYSLGALGSGLFVGLDENGDSYIEADRMLIRKVATFVQLLIQELKHVGGQIVLSPASMRCSRVEEYDTYYRCYFETTDGDRTINQEFVAGDQARCQTFNIKEGVNENVTNQYYWRLVTATGDNYIDLSKADCDAGSTAPRAGDDIVQLGNRTDATRQGAIVLSAYGTDSPSIKLYKGINSYQLTGKERLSLSPQAVNIIADSLKFTTGEDVKEQLSAAGSNIAALQTRMSAAELKITPDAIVSTVSGTIATAKQEAISAAASDATTKANNALASAKSDAAAKYATITTVNTMSTQISQLSNQISLKANSSTVTTLQNNLNAANSNITALQQRMSAAEVKITPDAIVSTVVGSGQVPYKKQVIIDATGLAEKWWLVTIGRISEYVPTIITVNSPLQASYGKPSWATHASGFSVTLRWSTNGDGWGISGSVERVVHEFAYGWCSGSITPVGSIWQMTHSSYEYVYVRGGGKYIFYVESSFSDIRNVSVTLHTTNYTLQGQTVTSPVTSVTIPVVDLKTKQTAEQIKSQLVQTPEGFKFYGKVVDIKASILTAQNIAALNISTGNLTVTTGAKIGGWQVSGNSLVCTGQASAQLNVNISGTRFLRINNSSTLLSIRADGITGESITVYGEGSKGLYVLCNASGSGTAIESFGNCSFTARQNEEITFSGLVQMGGLRLAYKRVNTTYTCNWQDCFIEVSGSQTIYLPASPKDGRVIYIAKVSGVSYRVTINGNGKDIFRQGVRVSSFYTESEQVLLQFYYCQGYWMYVFLKSKY